MRHQYLAAMGRAHDPSGPIHRWPEVVAITLDGGTRMQAHPNAQLEPISPALLPQGCLCLDGCSDRIDVRPKCRPETITRG
jgi:hypothetical protein